MKIIEEFIRELPPILWRHEWDYYKKQHGVPYSRGTMQNFDSNGTGPESYSVSGRVCYRKSDFIDWIHKRTTKNQVKKGTFMTKDNKIMEVCDD